MDNKLGYSILTVALLISMGLNVQPSDNYYCETRNITYHCDSLSKYYGLPNGKCINDILPNKLCRSGWQEIFRNAEKIKKAKSYICNQTDCIPML